MNAGDTLGPYRVLDHVQTVERARLVSFVGALDAAQMRHVCRALAIATGCAD